MRYFIISSVVTLQVVGWIDRPPVELVFYSVIVAVDTTFILTLTPPLFFQGFTGFRQNLMHTLKKKKNNQPQTHSSLPAGET